METEIDPNNKNNFNISIILFIILVIILTNSLDIFLNIGRIIMVIIIIFYTLNYFNPPIANKLQIIITNLINCISQPQSQTDISNQPTKNVSDKNTNFNKQTKSQSESYINLNESNIRNLNGKSTNSNRNLAQS